MPRPMPRLPPVTTATFPFHEVMIRSCVRSFVRSSGNRPCEQAPPERADLGLALRHEIGIGRLAGGAAVTQQGELGEHGTQDAGSRALVKRSLSGAPAVGWSPPEQRSGCRRRAGRARERHGRVRPPVPSRLDRVRAYMPVIAGGAVFSSMSNVIMNPFVPWESNAFSPLRIAFVVLGITMKPSFLGAPQ